MIEPPEVYFLFYHKKKPVLSLCIFLSIIYFLIQQ